MKKSQIPVQISEKKSPTGCQIPDHHSEIPSNFFFNDSQASGIVSVKNPLIADHTFCPVSLIFSHVFPSHSVILPQFCMARMIPVIAATTPAIIPMIGASAPAPKKPIIDVTAVITGIRDDITANTPARTPMKVCTGPGRLENPSMSPVIFSTSTGRYFVAIPISFSPSGASASCRSLIDFCISCMAVVVLSDISCAAPATSE